MKMSLKTPKTSSSVINNLIYGSTISHDNNLNFKFRIANDFPKHSTKRFESQAKYTKVHLYENQYNFHKNTHQTDLIRLGGNVRNKTKTAI